MNDDSGDGEGDEGEDDKISIKADVVKQEVCSRDEVMHIGMSDYSQEAVARLSYTGWRTSYVGERVACSQFVH